MLEMRVAHLSIACALMLAVTAVSAADAIESKSVRFAKGASSATIKGTLKGGRIIDYKLSAKAGQTMSVSLKTSNGANYFNVLPPGSKDVGIYNSSIGGNDWTGRLEADGEYKIRLYLMRSAARRNETARYTLTMGITGSASSAGPSSAAPSSAAAMGAAPAGDAKVKGTPYHATGQVPCSLGNAAPGSAQCTFGVVRGKPGNAEVHVTPPGGFERVLTFMGTKVSAAGDAKVKAAKDGDTWVIEVNDFEHYRIPEAVVSGG